MKNYVDRHYNENNIEIMNLARFPIQIIVIYVH